MSTQNKEVCKLCLKEAFLQKSHTIPKFVFRWLKKTSATGFFVASKNVSIRYQDGEKENIFCRPCEEILNKDETKFASRVFYPYVEKELDSMGVAQGVIKTIQYEEWLLKFCISLQFRNLMKSFSTIDNIEIKDKFKKILLVKYDHWRKYLLGEYDNTGQDESHLIFYQNLLAADGDLPENLNEQVVFYMLRAVDGTIVCSNRNLGMYVKIGPMIFFTSIIPQSLNNMPDSRIHKVRTMVTEQKLMNPKITEFLFVTRPNEIMPWLRISENRQKNINDKVEKDRDRYLHSQTTMAQYSDIQLKG